MILENAERSHDAQRCATAAGLVAVQTRKVKTAAAIRRQSAGLSIEEPVIRCLRPNPSPLIPVTLLTGFLGSGKTTVLNHVLSSPAMAATAVIINEFGEIGLDHLLVERASDDVVLLNSGCLCCTVRGDIVDTLTRAVRRPGQAARSRVSTAS